MKRIAVIGGGISGLTAAFRLEQKRKQGTALEYLLFEAAPHFGGVIRTEQIEGCVVEAGPDSFLSEKPWAADLCRELGLGDQLIASNDAERKTYILIGGRLVPLPDGLMFMVPTKLWPAFASPLFSWRTKLRMLREWFYRPAASIEDSTVAEFVARHYGREMVDRVADPLLAGVYGGSANELSVKSVLSRFVQMEGTYGSLGKGMLVARKLQTQSSRPLFTSLSGGMQQLIDAVLKHIPHSSRSADSPVQEVRSESGRWLVVSNGRTQEFDGVIIATPSHTAGKLLAQTSPEISADLRAIPYSSSVTVALEYDAQVRATLPPGFGFLVPQGENICAIAATFVHNKFPTRVPNDRALLRCSLGGTRNPEIIQLAEDQIIEIARRDLKQVLGINANPLFTRVYKWREAMAQYTVGHAARIERISAHLERLPGLALAGNYLGGIGVPDCVRAGTAAASQILR